MKNSNVHIPDILKPHLAKDGHVPFVNASGNMTAQKPMAVPGSPYQILLAEARLVHEWLNRGPFDIVRLDHMIQNSRPFLRGQEKDLDYRVVRVFYILYVDQSLEPYAEEFRRIYHEFHYHYRNYINEYVDTPDRCKEYLEELIDYMEALQGWQIDIL